MFSAAALAAQPPPPAAPADNAAQFLRYADVAEWTGRITYVYRATWDQKYPSGAWTHGESIERGVIVVHLDKVARRFSGVAWRGSGSTQASFETHEHSQGGRSQVDGSIGPPSDITASAEGRFSQPNNWLEMDFAKGTFKAGSGGGTPIPYESTWTAHTSPPNIVVTKGSFSPSSNRVVEGETLPRPAAGAIIAGSDTVARVGNLTGLGPPVRSGVQWELTASWSFEPVWRDAELVVSVDGYEKWRPQASRDPRVAGNALPIHAELRSRDGQPLPYQAKTITFELLDTSREPGVSMNWPLKKALPEKEPYDLRFLIQKDAAMEAPDEQGQKISTVDGKYLQASALLSSFDWGGWSTLKVTAQMQDGRQITGHLVGESDATPILLPKRAADSKIADIWKQNAAVTRRDDDDSETGPAGDSSPGDGLSLYEEYRGFYVKGQHVSGRPKQIDFFVRNDIGADARPGIDLFANLTGAEVHALRDDEFDRQTRVVNANHGVGPHLIDQHGVLLKTQGGLEGGLTVLSKAGVRGRPVITLSVNLQPRDSLTSMVTSENVPVSDLAFAYDRAVAHELMHTVGAEHHGTGDGKETFFFVYGDDPQNATGKARFRFPLMDGGRTATITDEASGRDLASLMEGDMMLLRERLRPELYPDMLTAARKFLADRPGYNIPWTAEQIAEHDLDSSVANYLAPTWYIGAAHGECSGNELCVMRYYFARLYEKKGQAGAFYYITERSSERAGLDLCRLPTGTGVNDKDRKAQPRYGDAAPTRGGCAASIIFNDALPLKSDAIAREPQQ